MDSFTFIAKIVKAVAWPLAAVLLAWLFRDELREKLKNLKKGKIGPLEAEFEEGVKKAAEKAAELKREGPAETEAVPSFAEVDANTLTLARSAPQGTIMTAWFEVETELARLAQTKVHLTPDDSRDANKAIRAINNAQLLEPKQISLLRELRGLRMRAAHEPEFKPSIESVLTYVQMAKELAGALHKAAETP